MTRHPVSVARSPIAPKQRFTLTVLAFLLLPALATAAEAVLPTGDGPMPTSDAALASVDTTTGTPSLAAPEQDGSMLPEEQRVEAAGALFRCMPERTTDPVTRVGATCLRARQKAAAAARERVECWTGTCEVSHSVAPCQPITNGFSATAVATYRCKNPKWCGD